MRHPALPLERGIRTAGASAMLVRVRNELDHVFRRREVPKPILREVLPRSGVLDAACFVRLVERKSGALPFVAQPLSRAQYAVRRRKLQTAAVVNAHFG